MYRFTTLLFIYNINRINPPLYQFINTIDNYIIKFHSQYCRRNSINYMCVLSIREINQGNTNTKKKWC